MKLSEAILMGSTIVKMVPADLNSCAYGAALHAVGAKNISYIAVFDRWPWVSMVSESGLRAYTPMGKGIYDYFDGQVCRGIKTLEQLVDYVASIEPSCGECNRFQCTCTKETNQESSKMEIEVTI